MVKLTKSLPVIKERNCSASLVLDTRTNRKNVSEYSHTEDLLAHCQHAPFCLQHSLPMKR